MIKEAYCSFEVAKLLKEKGFPQDYDIYHSMIYNEKDYKDEYEVQRMVTETRFIKAGTLSSYPVSVPEPKCYAPTHQIAMKWLREVHNKHCDIGYDIDLNWFFQIIDLKETVEYDYLETKYYHTENETGFNSYEDAVEAALIYCLKNLI